MRSSSPPSVGIIALLWSRWPISLAWLKALELGMIGMLASRLTFVQYRLMLEFSLRDDRMMAQLTMKNVVLLTSILILTYGLYVPKSWRRAALVVGPLALLALRDLAGPLFTISRGDGVAGARVEQESVDPADPTLRLRCDDLAHPGRRLDLRDPHDLPAAPAGRRGPAARPVPPPTADRLPAGWARSTSPSTSS